MATDYLCDFLNRDDHVITVNDKTLTKVLYISATDKYSFHLADNVSFMFTRENITDALQDEGPDGIPFYIFIDTNGIHHIVKLHRNDSVGIMRQVKDKF